jgi:hypothetical protein
MGTAVLAAGIAVAIALRPVASLFPRLLMAPPRTVFVGACALAAAAVSWWVVHRTLRDEPLSIDAGVYLFQARAMAHGHFGMPAPVPAQAFGDRFLLEGPDGRLYGIFPPGWPLALVPFVWLGRPMLAGPSVAVLLVLAQAWLGRALGRAAGDEREGELATRASLLLALPSIGRALETADLLSHAFVAALACLAIAAALTCGRGPIAVDAAASRRAAALAGACVGWVLASRLLDGLVLAGAVAGALAWSGAGRRAGAWCAVGALPFVALLVVEQHAATGAWLLPTQAAYFERSDWPPSCHRLGFGPDIGCTVEHPGPVARLGGHGFGPRQSLAVVRERAGSLGEELLGFAPLALLAFLPVILAASAVDLVAVAFVMGLTLAYGLFYYGNAMFFGARHLFPAAPFVWLLAARGAALLPHRGRGWLDASHLRGAALLATLTAAAITARTPWRERLADASAFQSGRSDLRRTLSTHGIERGILKTRDYTAFAAAFDSWADGDSRFFALEDGSGLLELRRAHPDLPVLLSLSGDELGRLYPSRPPAGMLVEIERAWPSFVQPSGLATKQLTQDAASGGTVLLVSHAAPGAHVAVPFDVAVAGEYAVHVDGFASPDGGDYELVLDGEPLATWRGYASAVNPSRTADVRRAVSSGRHVLIARCTGHDVASTGYDARLDALVGERIEP